MNYSSLLFLFALFPSLAKHGNAVPAAELHVAPYLQQVTENGITIRWETTDPIIGAVEFGQGGKFNRVANESAAVKLHEVGIVGLAPGETYGYRVKFGNQVLEAASFTTAPRKGTEVWRFAVYGDNRSDPDTHGRVVAQIIEAQPDIVLTTGDLVARGNNYMRWKDEFFDPLKPLTRKIPVYVSLGNHEDHAQNYFDYFTFPNPDNEQFYSFDYGNAHFIALDSDVTDLEDPQAFDERQLDWLKRDLQENAAAVWKIVFFHHPIFNAHPKRPLGAALHWQPIFEAHGVDLVITGHDHYYLRNYDVGVYTGNPKRGVRHITTGGGGAGLYPVVERIHAAARKSVHHLVAMDVMGDRIVARAIDIDGHVIDSFVIDKQADVSPEEFIAFEMYQIENQLKGLIEALPELPVGDDMAELSTTLELENPFTVPIRMSVIWNVSDGWSINPGESEKVLEPGEKIIIPIEARGPNQAAVNPPQGKIAFARVDGEKAFRNDELLFFPVKIWSDILFSRTKTSMTSVSNRAALMRSITTIPIPIVDMDGTVLDYRPISDSFPADGLIFGNVRLNGNLLGVEFADELSEGGRVRLRNQSRMEFSFDTTTRFEGIDIDLRAEKLNEKICVGTFDLVPRSDAALGGNEFTASFGSDSDESLDVVGWLRITAYAKNGMAGEFELNATGENGEVSILNGRFKLPLRLD